MKRTYDMSSTTRSPTLDDGLKTATECRARLAPGRPRDGADQRGAAPRHEQEGRAEAQPQRGATTTSSLRGAQPVECPVESPASPPARERRDPQHLGAQLSEAAARAAYGCPAEATQLQLRGLHRETDSSDRNPRSPSCIAAAIEKQ